MSYGITLFLATIKDLRYTTAQSRNVIRFLGQLNSENTIPIGYMTAI